MAENDNDTASSGLPVTTQLIITAFLAIAWHNVIWMNAAIWVIFKRWSGLYFYTLLVASWGVAVHQLGFMLLFFGITKSFAASFAPITIGFYFMVTGQSLMLYSRLHLIVRNKRKIRWVLGMIFTNALIFHIPTTIFFTMQHYHPALAPRYAIWEKIQVTAFGVQEIVISALYVYETHKLLKPSEHFQKARFRQSMRQLMYANIFIIVLDITVVSIQYANFFQIQVVFKGAVYSVKLLIEFFVLNQLMDAVGVGANVRSGASNPSNAYKKNDSALKYASNKKPSNIMASGTFNEFENLHMDTFTAAANDAHEKSAHKHTRSFGPSAPVISADRNGALPPDLDKIHVVQTVEYRTGAALSITRSQTESEEDAYKMGAKGRDVSPSSSKVDFATKGY